MLYDWGYCRRVCERSGHSIDRSMAAWKDACNLPEKRNSVPRAPVCDSVLVRTSKGEWQYSATLLSWRELRHLGFDTGSGLENKDEIHDALEVSPWMSGWLWASDFFGRVTSHHFSPVGRAVILFDDCEIVGDAHLRGPQCASSQSVEPICTPAPVCSHVECNYPPPPAGGHVFSLPFPV